jgi:hypothetical protein
MMASRTELDSHADTCTFGKGAYVCYDTGETVSVEPFMGSLGSISQIPIVTAAVAYDDPITYKTFVLFFPQSLYIDNMEHNLLCCEQLQHNQVQINETPLIHIRPEDRHVSDHSILVETPTGEILHIPLELDGTTSFFHTRIPTKQELDDDTLAVHVYMTSDMKWDPQSDQHHMVKLPSVPH